MKKSSSRNSANGISREEILRMYRNHVEMTQNRNEENEDDIEDDSQETTTPRERELAKSAIIWADDGGEILNKISNPVHNILEMQRTEGKIKVLFRVMEAAQGNGSAKVRIWHKNKLVFSAYGDQFEWCRKISKYEPGDWEKLIPNERR